MIMERKIEVGTEIRRKICKMFGVTSKTVSNALTYAGTRGESDTAKRIRKVALENGGRRMVYCPECETLFDSEGNLRQTFPNGAVLLLDKRSGTGIVTFNGKEIVKYGRVMMSELEDIQKEAARLR